MVTSSVNLDSLQRQTSMPLKWGSLNLSHLLAGLTPSRNITASSLLHSVESGDVPAASVEEYQHHLPEIYKGYSLWDIFNVDESSLFYQQLQCRSLVQAKDPHKSGKGQMFKDHITVIFAWSAIGEKLKLTVIGCSKSLHSLWGTKGINPVCYCYTSRHGQPAPHLKPTSAGSTTRWSHKAARSCWFLTMLNAMDTTHSPTSSLSSCHQIPPVSSRH